VVYLRPSNHSSVGYTLEANDPCATKIISGEIVTIMKTEATLSNKVTSERMYSKLPLWARKGMAGAAIIGSGVALTACATEAEPTTLKAEYTVGDVQLDAELADSRMHVLEMCNTGDGAEEMRQAWTDYGFEERSGYNFMDAIKVSTDFTYIDETGVNKDHPNKAILYYGEYTYPTIELLAENCNEVAWLASQTPSDITSPEGASKLLEEFRDPDTDLIPEALQGLYNHVAYFTTEASE